MSEEKGKGRAKADIDDGDKGTTYTEEQPSMLSRVAASASGLTRSAFASPNSNEFNARVSSALERSGKGQVGRSSSSSVTGNSAWHKSSTATHQQAHLANPAGVLRVGHNEQHIRKSEDEFSSFLNGIGSLIPSEDTGDSHFASAGLGDDLGERSRAQYTVLASDLQQLPSGSVAEQQSRDGEDVLAILSQNSAIEETFSAWKEDENYEWGLSAEQLSELRAMTKDLFPSIVPHGAVDPDHPRNLAPNFEGAHGQPMAGSDEWREQWDGVLNRYTDEVWGDLLPLVQEARKEVEELRSDASSTEQPKALRRLGAILRHLRS